MTALDAPTSTPAEDEPMIDASAEVAVGARIGPRTRIWHQVQITADVQIGADCVLGKGVYVSSSARIGDRTKIQNGCGIFGATLEDDVMVAPGVYLLEDPAPRAVTPHGQPKQWQDWRREPVTVRQGATVGANAVVAPGVTIGRYAMVAIAAAVHRDVPDHGLVGGNPARQIGWVCACGHSLDENLTCPTCDRRYRQCPFGLLPAT
jgi:UDP-2-acetamido-3-amino-2,3-dideoxy-glucuronate N-acetyltransferase